MGDWSDWVGRSVTHSDILTPGLITRHRATLDRPAGKEALPGIHWCLCPPEEATALLGCDGHPRRDVPGAFLPPIPLPRRMWASSSVEWHAPIRAGASVTRTSTITAVNDKTGSSGPLIFVTLAHDMLADDVLAVREQQTLVYRAANAAAPDFMAPRPGAADIDTGEWSHSQRLTPTEPLLLRYSALTFNAHRIHYDLPYAHGEEGYAGLVVHGPLTATLLMNFAAEQFGPLSTFAFRGLAPAFAGEVMTLVARREGDAITLAALGPTGEAAMHAQATLSS